MDNEKLSALFAKLRTLRHHQIEYIEDAVRAFESPLRSATADNSDFVNAEFAAVFGDLLRLHHSFSGEPFTKDKFEHAMVRVLKGLGHEASLAPRGNRGHDITVDGVPWSLKTQADRGIKRGSLYISKFMELGHGVWRTEDDLPGLRDQMVRHMDSYERIFCLRCLSTNRSHGRTDMLEYELVEIPKSLLLRAQQGHFEMMHESRQDPKPGYCTVAEGDETVLFRLYFDGGTERKLQIKELSKNACVVHASWEFSIPS